MPVTRTIWAPDIGTTNLSSCIVWPNQVPWLAAHGYEYVSFDGAMFVEFASHEEAAELTEIFYPAAVEEVRRRRLRVVPYDVLGINAPRDLAYKMITR